MALDDLKKALLDGEGGEGDTDEESDYAPFVQSFQDILGLDEAKAKELCDTICDLVDVHAEAAEDNDDEDAPRKKGKKGLMLLLGDGDDD